jgi:hypothetical protein
MGEETLHHRREDTDIYLRPACAREPHSPQLGRGLYPSEHSLQDFWLQPGVVVHTCNPSFLGRGWRMVSFKSAQTMVVRWLCQTQNTNKRAERGA